MELHDPEGIRGGRVDPVSGVDPVSAFSSLRFGISVFLFICGALTLAYGSFWWTACWWLLAAAHFSYGYWQLTIARSGPSRS